MTVTTGCAFAAVHWLRCLPFAAREAMPPPTTRTAMATPARAAMRSPRRETVGTTGSGDMRLSNDRGRRDVATVLTVDEAEDNGNEDQRGDGCARQPADDRATERRGLLPAFAQAQRQRRHAADHRQRRHHCRWNPHDARLRP